MHVFARAQALIALQSGKSSAGGIPLPALRAMSLQPARTLAEAQEDVLARSVLCPGLPNDLYSLLKPEAGYEVSEAQVSRLFARFGHVASIHLYLPNVYERVTDRKLAEILHAFSAVTTVHAVSAADVKRRKETKKRNEKDEKDEQSWALVTYSTPDNRRDSRLAWGAGLPGPRRRTATSVRQRQDPRAAKRAVLAASAELRRFVAVKVTADESIRVRFQIIGNARI